MASPGPPSKPLDLELTVVCAKHLKNVNWRIGDLKPYAIFWIEPNHKHATKPDESGSVKPVWNERFILPVPLPAYEASLTLEIFHSKPSETPKPLVGTLHFPLKNLIDSPGSRIHHKTLDLTRPSGRPHGKISLKLAVRELPLPPMPPAPDYEIVPPASYCYSGPILPSRDCRPYSPSYRSPVTATLPAQPSHYGYSNYCDPYSSYYSSGCHVHDPHRPYVDRLFAYGGPSAPVDFSSGFSCNDQKPKGSKMGFGTGLTVGAVAGSMGGLVIDDGLKREQHRFDERVDNDLPSRGEYTNYHDGY